MVFALYLIGYSISQIVIFIWRLNEVVLWNLKQAQVTGIIVAIAGILLAVYLRKAAQNRDTQEA